jgi:hypothetical protein
MFLFRLFDFRPFTLRLFITSTPLGFDCLSLQPFRSSGFWSLKLLCTRFSQSALTRRLRSADTYPPGNQWPGSTSGLRRFWSLLVHKLLELWILRHLSSLTMDGPYSLRDFDKSTLLCTHGLSLVQLPLDPTYAGPLRSDPTDGICSSPLCFSIH